MVRKTLTTYKVGYQLVGAPGVKSAEERRAAQWADWELIASVAPRTRDEAISGTELIKRLRGQLSEGKVRERLNEYRQAVKDWDEDGYDRDPGLRTWLGKDGRGYWRACACRMEFEPCGLCEGCTGAAGCRASTLRPVIDPECTERHPYCVASTS